MGMAGNAKMEAMKTEMMKCAVCKNVAMRMDEIGPMGMEPVKLNDGFSVRHWVMSNDPAKIAAFHAACDACGKAGEACMTMTDAQAKTDLCGFCQGIRTAMKAGAHMSKGMTKKGDVMVVTSADAAVQGQLTALAEKCEMMAASMEAPASKTSAEKP
jgi:phosphoribosylaminoimidazole (AIR) synthetase